MTSSVTLQPLTPRPAHSSATGTGKPPAGATAGSTTSIQGNTQVNAYSDVQKSALPQQEPQPQDQLEEQELTQVMNRLNELVQNVRRELNFRVDDDSGHTVIEVIDSETEEVLRQIPPEDVLTLLEHLQNFGNGFVREKV
ncbi:MAG: flagellar protein FlaG [Chromatiaceae bacterium]|nr:flagellar protein FlaG [Chromatiaceae bacterium]